MNVLIVAIASARLSVQSSNVIRWVKEQEINMKLIGSKHKHKGYVILN